MVVSVKLSNREDGWYVTVLISHPAPNQPGYNVLQDTETGPLSIDQALEKARLFMEGN